MKSSESDYHRLFKISRETKMLSSIKGLLGWDQETYMPKNGISLRSKQIAYMANLVHKEATSNKFKTALSKLIDIDTGECFDESLSSRQCAALREWRRDYVRETKLPSTFVKRFAKTTSEARQAWQLAKENNAFKPFAPHLEKIVSLVRKKADHLGYDEHPYDALVDLYEPQMTTSRLTSLFGKLQLELTSLLKKIRERPEPSSDFLKKNYDTHKQFHFGKRLLKAMGFSPDSSRIDPTAHPFCLTLSPDDLRLTTWLHPENLPTHLFAILHEGGHGLYEKNLPAEHFGSPLGESASLGVHESQSRLWEVFIGQSRPFWEHFYPLLQKEFPENLQGVYLEDFFKAINLIKPSFIRVEADEVTYCLHVILRFEIEKALIEGHIKVRDIPEIWNDKMRTYLGIGPSTDDKGCLQDIHWALGAIGYFPTYALGNLYAAQLFSSFEKATPHWRNEIAKGNLSICTSYLAQKVHKWGRQYPPEKLIEQATGQPLSTDPFIAYLNNKYAALYHF